MLQKENIKKKTDIYNLAKERNKNTYQVTCADDINSKWFVDLVDKIEK